MTTKTTTFTDLHLLEQIQKAIKDLGYVHPTPIQQQAIPHLLEGKDLLGCAQTGTGKTAAFALPILHRLMKTPSPCAPKETKVLVLAPTRELAVQIDESFCQYGKYLKLKTALVFGGVGQGPQVSRIAKGVDVLIATPGRLMDLIQQRHIRLGNVQAFVLDEADRMLDMGFINEIKKIIRMLPPVRHNLFFSATMPKEIENLAGSMLKNPIRVEVTPISSTAERIEQSVMYVDKDDKRSLLLHLFKTNPKIKRTIIFTRTKHGANKVTEILVKNRISAEAIHGNKSQAARQRALENFRAGKIRALIATDIAARGIDVDGITHVINFELPNIPESYVHRIGRTSRAGAKGEAISFCDSEERFYLKDIEKLIKQSIPLEKNHPFHCTKAPARPQLKKQGQGQGQRRRTYRR